MKSAALSGVAAAVAVLALSPAAAGSSSAVSTPSSPQGWYFSSTELAEDGAMTSTAGVGGWVPSELGGRPGPGSFLLQAGAGQRARLETTQFNRYPLGELTSFRYSSVTTGGTGHAPSVVVTVDPSGSEAFDGSDDLATLVWDAGTIPGGGWEGWDTSTEAGWWTPSLPVDSPAPGSRRNPTDLPSLVGLLGADSELRAISVDAGRHGPMTAHVDGVSVTTSDGTSSFDLEADRTQR